MALLIAIYRRVSTDEQASVVEGSLDNQLHRMKSFIDLKNTQEPNWARLIEVYTDDGYSAKDTNRPAYKKMMTDIARGKVNMVMVTELSRLSRNILDFCEFLKVLDNQNGKFFSIKEQFDTSNPAGKMMLYNMINLAQFEREQTSERVAINAHARAQRGLLNGGPAILGYDKDPTNRTTFIVNEDEVRQVKKIFDLFIEIGTIGGTVTALEELGIFPKDNGRKTARLVKEGRWTFDSLNFIVNNMAYIGVREINKAYKNRDQSLLKSWQKYSLAKASWPAIVDKKKFEFAQKIMRENKEKQKIRLDMAEDRIFSLSNIVKCNQCGKGLVGQTGHGRNHTYKYYIHSYKKGDVVTCDIKRLQADEVEAIVSNHLADILVQGGYFDTIEQNIRNTILKKPDDIKIEKQRLEKEIKKISISIRNAFKLQTEFGSGSEALSVVAKELEIMSQQKRTLEKEYEFLLDQETHQADIDEAVVDLKERLESFRRGWSKARPLEKRNLLRRLIKSVVVTPEGFHIEYYLKNNLNTVGILKDSTVTKIDEPNVINLEGHRRKIKKTMAEKTKPVHRGVTGSHDTEIGDPYGIRTRVFTVKG